MKPVAPMLVGTLPLLALTTLAGCDNPAPPTSSQTTSAVQFVSPFEDEAACRRGGVADAYCDWLGSKKTPAKSPRVLTPQANPYKPAAKTQTTARPAPSPSRTSVPVVRTYVAPARTK